MKIEGLGEDQVYEATDMLATKYNLLHMFFIIPDYLKKWHVI